MHGVFITSRRFQARYEGNIGSKLPIGHWKHTTVRMCNCLFWFMHFGELEAQRAMMVENRYVNAEVYGY